MQQNQTVPVTTAVQRAQWVTIRNFEPLYKAYREHDFRVTEKTTIGELKSMFNNKYNYDPMCSSLQATRCVSSGEWIRSILLADDERVLEILGKVGTKYLEIPEQYQK